MLKTALVSINSFGIVSVVADSAETLNLDFECVFCVVKRKIEFRSGTKILSGFYSRVNIMGRRYVSV